MPPLPRRLADPRPLIVLSTAVWAIAAVVLALTGAPASWVWTCVAGIGLGVVGYGVMAWQRSAARRGSRGAQRGLT